MATEYITARFPEGEFDRVTDRHAAMLRVDGFVRPDTRLRQRFAGGEFGKWRDEHEGDKRFRAVSAKMPLGQKLIVQRESDLEQLSIRKVQKLVVPDLGAAPELELLRAEIVEEFGMELLRDGGLYVCRYVDGTTVVSRHGYQTARWKGAANDLFVTSGGMAGLEEVYDFTVSRLKFHNFLGAEAIVNKKIYIHGVGEKAYGGATHYHLHYDVVAGSPCK